MRLSTALVGIAVATMTVSSLAQTASHPAFEVASIKPNHTGAGEHSSRVQPGGRLIAVNMPVSSLIASAFGANGQLLRRNQVEGGPDWIRVDGFDIDAKAPASAGFEAGATSPNDSRIQAMLRTLLEERFKLVTHVEHRAVPVYELKMARSDRRLGSALHPLQIDCAAAQVTAAHARQAGPSVWDNRPVCLVAVGAGGTSVVSYGGTMAQLANVLSTMTDRLVVDATGLSGQFELSATFEPTRAAADAGVGTSLFTALREQLGLELNADKQDIDIVVIDHVERPTEN